MGSFLGYVLAVIFILGGFGQLQNHGAEGFFTGLCVIALGILFVVGINGSRKKERQQEIDDRVDEALRKREE